MADGQGILYVVATPIGNPEDLTPRAAQTLRDVDLVVCEEWTEGKRLMHQLGIEGKELALLNEHTKVEGIDDIIALLEAGRSIALVSDCGTPLVADPGRHVVERAAQLGMRIVPVPGVSSFIAALMVAGFPLEEFVFRGMLSAKSDERRRQLAALRREERTVILFDAPYRLERLMDDLAGTFGEGREAVLAMDLTTPRELILRGTCAAVQALVHGKQWKREFVVVLGNAPRQEHFRRNRVT